MSLLYVNVQLSILDFSTRVLGVFMYAVQGQLRLSIIEHLMTLFYS